MPLATRRRDRCALLEELFPASGLELAFEPPNDASSGDTPARRN